ncbi:MAG: hypothetical protein WAL66_01925 [Nitrososphaeraceae archaeon]
MTAFCKFVCTTIYLIANSTLYRRKFTAEFYEIRAEDIEYVEKNCNAKLTRVYTPELCEGCRDKGHGSETGMKKAIFAFKLIKHIKAELS